MECKGKVQGWSETAVYAAGWSWSLGSGENPGAGLESRKVEPESGRGERAAGAST